MFQRCVASFAVLVPFAVGCASGEPVGRFDRDLQLAEEEGVVVDAELIVEVTQHGVPLIADAVWLWDGGANAVDAHCMIHQGLGKCGTWFAEMEADGPITVFADVCGELYSQPLAFAIEPGADSFAFESHLSVEADASHCGRAQALTCDNVSDTPGLYVSVVDPQGDPLAFRDVEVEVFNAGAAVGDCQEAVSAQGCSEWASQHTQPGRYRARVEHCGETFFSEWIAVPADDSGCKAISQATELVVDTTVCAFAP